MALSEHSTEPTELAHAVRAKISDPTYLPTRLLAEFMGAGSEPEVVLDAQDVGLFYESLLAVKDNADALTLLLFNEKSGDMVGLIGDVPIRLPKDSTCIKFWRRLARAVVFVPCDVQLGLGGIEFRIGPYVDLDCKSLICPTDTLIVTARGTRDDKDSGVAIVAESYSGSARKIVVHAPPQEQGLIVQWEGMAFPWVQYRRTATVHVAHRAAVAEAYTHLSRLLKWFRSDNYGELARHRDLIENFAVGGTRDGKRLLDYCIGEKLIVGDGTMYKIDASRAREIGIHWVDLRDRRLPPSVAEFLERFVQAENGR
jgi:hypothetical protein